MKNSTLDPTNRCAFTFTDGRRCRMLRSTSHPSFCLTLMAQGRISRHTANTLGYLAQLLLQSMPDVRREVIGAVGHSGAYDALLRQQIPLFHKFRKT